ncbi:hypothetical protein ACOSP7_002326 [Xanthoceras sorbifolium]
MQDNDSKQPDFFVKPTTQNPHALKRTHLVLISTEFEFPDSVKRGGVVFEPKKGENPDAESVKKPEKPVVCARRKLMSATGTRSVVLIAVDASDVRCRRVVSEEDCEDRVGDDRREQDCLEGRFEHRVRQRAREGGISRITKLHFVSAMKNWGLKGLIDDVVDLAGKRGNVWGIGAQNAGKSTMLNAIAKCIGGGREGGGGEEGKKVVSHLTEVPCAWDDAWDCESGRRFN